MPPPPKLASKIAELSGKNFTKNIFLLFDIISRTRLYWDFSKKSGVSLNGFRTTADSSLACLQSNGVFASLIPRDLNFLKNDTLAP